MLDLLQWTKDTFVKHAKIEKAQLEKFSQKQWITIIKLFRNRIRSPEELESYAYLFKEPVFTTEKAQKSMNRVFKSEEKSLRVLKDMSEILEKKVPEDSFTSAKITELLGGYLSENQKVIKNEEVYHLLRFVLSGSHEGIPASDICELLGRSTTMNRIKGWIDGTISV